MEKLLIIGGTGNIGRSISQLAVNEQWYDVYVMTRNPDIKVLGAKMLYGDATDEVFLTALQQRYAFAFVINLTIQTTEQAQLNVRVFTGTIRQFMFISTVVVYNHATAIVLHETSEKGNSLSEYGARKLACEHVFMEAWQQDEFPITIVRPGQTYSTSRIPLSIKGNNCWTIITRLLAGQPVIVHGDGTSAWVCTHSDDFAVGCLGLVGMEQAIGEDFHITSSEVVAWNQIYHTLGQLLSVSPHIVHIPTDVLVQNETYNLQESIQGDKQFSVMYCNDKIRSFVPAFQPQISLASGLRQYISYMDAHPELKIIDPIFAAWCDTYIERYTQAIAHVR